MTRSLLKDSSWNFFGSILGNIVSLIGYPIFVRLLGTDRFGVSSIAGAIVGYFMLFDMGIGRASIIVIGKAIESRDPRRISGLFWSGQLVMFCFGAVGSLLMALATPLLCHRFLKVPPHLMEESIAGLILISASIPLLIVFSGQLGYLSCIRNFRALNLIRIVMNILTWLLPILALQFRSNLIVAFGVQLILRFLLVLIALGTCLYLEPILRKPLLSGFGELKELFSQGGWISVTNLISPLMSYMDRAILGSMASLSAVTYYSVAGDTAQKIWIVQAAVVGAVFPSLPGLLLTSREKAKELCLSGFRLLMLALVPLFLFLLASGPFLLRHWIGSEIAQHVYLPFSIILVGAFANSFAHIPFSLLAADGKSKHAALLHLAEAPVFFLLLFLLVRPFGVCGAASAWTIRVLLDALGLGFMGFRILPGLHRELKTEMLWIALALATSLTYLIPLDRTIPHAAALVFLLGWAWSNRAFIRLQLSRLGQFRLAGRST